MEANLEDILWDYLVSCLMLSGHLHSSSLLVHDFTLEYDPGYTLRKVQINVVATITSN